MLQKEFSQRGCHLSDRDVRNLFTKEERRIKKMRRHGGLLRGFLSRRGTEGEFVERSKAAPIDCSDLIMPIRRSDPKNGTCDTYDARCREQRRGESAF